MKKAAVLAICLFAAPTYAVEDGMFLCRSPVFANDFWGSLIAAQQNGVHLNKTIEADIAQKNECKFIASENLKPIDFVAGEFSITDGNIKGWADPHLYIMYVNRKK